MSGAILSVAYPLAPVSPDAVGGAEQVLSQIDSALVAAGKRSVVIACEGSRVAGELISIPRFTGELDEATRKSASTAVRDEIARATRERDVAAIHLHGVDFYEYAPEDVDMPVVVTVHLPPEWYPPDALTTRRANFFFHCVSTSQRSRCPAGMRVLPEIPNGVAIPAEYRKHKDRFALCLGRICPEKGFHVAADACRFAGMPLKIAGEVFGYEEHQRYFEQELIPRFGDGVEFIGPLGGQCKQRLLTCAACVLIPSLAAETSSLVAMEAMAAGTPVIAFPSGALKDLVRDGETGYVVNDLEQMADAIGRVAAIAPETCRRYAEEHFAIEKATARYLEVYERLAPSTRASASTRSERLQCEVVESRQVLAAIEDEWRFIFQESGSATPFQSPEWLLSWWDAFHPGELRFVVAREHGRLVGLAPLYMADDRCLRFVGVSLSDSLDFIALPGYERRVAEESLSALASRSDWDTADFDEMPVRSALPYARTPAQWRVAVTDSSVCAGVTVSPLNIPKKLLKNIRYYRNKLKEAGEIEYCGIGDSAGTVQSVEELIRLHEKRWKEKLGGGVLSDATVQRFQRSVAPRLAAAGMLEFCELRVNGTTIAILYRLLKGMCVYYYLGGFDPEFDQYSPGTLILAYALEQASARGKQEVDFLRGDEPYKRLWNPNYRRNRRVRIERN